MSPEEAARRIDEYWSLRLGGSDMPADDYLRDAAAGDPDQVAALQAELVRIEQITGHLAARRELLRTIAVLEECELVRFLGSGGMGEVWLLRKPNGQELAMKLPLDPLSDVEVQALAREVDAASRLDHPWIVRPMALRLSPQPYLLEEYVEGVPVNASVLADDDREIVAASLFAKIADALGHAHRRHVLHGDLKPQNVLVDASLNPHILDFGLARLGGDRSREIAGGTMGYSPPEAMIDSGDVGPWSDLYSLCMMLRQAVTGEVSGPLHNVSPGLRQILQRGTDRRIRKRYRDGAELADDLRQVLRVPWLRPGRRGRRVAAWAAAAALAGLLAVVAGPAVVGATDTQDDLRQLWEAPEPDPATAMQRIPPLLRASGDAADLSEAILLAGARFPGMFQEELWQILLDRPGSANAPWAMWALCRADPADWCDADHRAHLQETVSVWLEEGGGRKVRAALLAVARLRLDVGVDRLGAILHAERDAQDLHERKLAAEALASMAGTDERAARALADAPDFCLRYAMVHLCLAATKRPDQSLRFWQHAWDRYVRWEPPPQREAEDWFLDERLAGASQPIREKLCDYLMECWNSLDGPGNGQGRAGQALIREQIARRKIAQALGILAPHAYRHRGVPVLNILLDEACDSRADEDVRLAAIESVGRILGRRKPVSAAQADIVEPLRQVLHAPPFSEDPWRGWALATEGALLAHAGDREAGRDLLIKAVDQGFCHPVFIKRLPFDTADLAKIVRRIRTGGIRTFRQPTALSGGETAAIAELRGGHWLEVRGWDCRLRATDTDPDEGRSELLLCYPHCSQIVLTFRLHQPQGLSLRWRMRSFNSSFLPENGYAHVQTLLDGQQVQVVRVQTDQIHEVLLGDRIGAGTHEIEIRLLSAITPVGVRWVELRGE